jgi:hypothetical protein
MVASKIKPGVVYTEKRGIDDEDKGFASSPYELELFGKARVVIIGKPKYTFVDKNIVFYPIYLVSAQGAIKAQIGVFEIPKHLALKVLDEDGEVDLDKMREPLLYSFVKESFVNRAGSDVDEYLREMDKKEQEQAPTKTTKEDDATGIDLGAIDLDEEGDEEEEEDMTKDLKVPKASVSEEVSKANKLLANGLFSVDRTKKQPATLPEEMKGDVPKKKDYTAAPSNTWIEKFMTNNHFGIVPVEANGDCFFAVIREAFKQVGFITTVEKLRAILAKEVTDEHFQERRNMYLMLSASIKNMEKELKEMKTIGEKDLKRRAEAVKDNREQMKRILKETEFLKNNYESLKKQKEQIEQVMEQGGYSDLAEIDTLEKFRAFITKSEFWADEFAISIMERILQVKFIILSERAYLDGAPDAVMSCGMADVQLMQQSTFAPRFYIMATFSGDHYKLVTYKHKRIFVFPEIPYQIKTLVVKKCMEGGAGLFNHIQEFRNYKTRLGLDPDLGKPTEKDEESDASAEARGEYDPKTVLVFFERSEKTAKPGKGVHEKMPPTRTTEFATLATFKEWRKKLDDAWITQFRIDGHLWASVEHYYQASKFKKGFPDFYLQFSLDMGGKDNKMATDVLYARAAGSKTGKYKKTVEKKKMEIQLRPTKVVIDPDFYGGHDKEDRETAVRAKFSQNQDLKQLLLATDNAKLVHHVHASNGDTDHILMKIRQELKTAPDSKE